MLISEEALSAVAWLCERAYGRSGAISTLVLQRGTSTIGRGIALRVVRLTMPRLHGRSAIGSSGIDHGMAAEERLDGHSAIAVRLPCHGCREEKSFTLA